jgi:hypothetical protein
MSEIRQNQVVSGSKREKWQLHVESWQSSGLSQVEYCHRQNISYKSFQYWRRRLKEESRCQSASSLTVVKLGEVGRELNSLNGIRQRLSSPSSSLRFWVNNFCVEVGDNFSPVTLTRLVESLRRL